MLNYSTWEIKQSVPDLHLFTLTWLLNRSYFLHNWTKQRYQIHHQTITYKLYTKYLIPSQAPENSAHKVENANISQVEQWRIYILHKYTRFRYLKLYFHISTNYFNLGKAKPLWWVTIGQNLTACILVSDGSLTSTDQGKCLENWQI